MRFLHTADWHLGRSFHGESLHAAHSAMVDHLVELARSQQVDATLVAGDVYDRALPPVDAVRLADEALTRLAEVAPVLVISGNHDSAQRLGFGTRLLDRAGVHVRTAVARVGEPVLVGGAAVYALPYLEPDLVRGELEAERSHTAVVAAAMRRVRADLAGRPRTASVVMAHAFVAGGVASLSERDLAVGGAGCVPPSVFAGVDYLALGHLHGPQEVGGGAGRYAGAPVALSFSETGLRKSSAVVELGAAGRPARCELVAMPVHRPLAVLRGTLDELLADPALAAHEGAWVQATLTDPVRPGEAMERLRRRFPHAVALVFDPQGAGAVRAGRYGERLEGRDDEQVVSGFVEDVRGRAADEDELALLRDALVAGRVDAVAV